MKSQWNEIIEENLFKQKTIKQMEEGIYAFEYLYIVENEEIDYINLLRVSYPFLKISKKYRVSTLTLNMLANVESVIFSLINNESQNDDLVISQFVKIRAIVEEIIYQAFIFTQTNGDEISFDRINRIQENISFSKTGKYDSKDASGWYKKYGYNSFFTLAEYVLNIFNAPSEERYSFNKVYDTCSNILHNFTIETIDTFSVVSLLYYSRNFVLRFFMSLIAPVLFCTNELQQELSLINFEILPDNIKPILRVNRKDWNSIKSSTSKTLISKRSTIDKSLVVLRINEKNKLNEWYIQTDNKSLDIPFDEISKFIREKFI